jgi:hypothetical protein
MVIHNIHPFPGMIYPISSSESVEDGGGKVKEKNWSGETINCGSSFVPKVFGTAADKLWTADIGFVECYD